MASKKDIQLNPNFHNPGQKQATSSPNISEAGSAKPADQRQQDSLMINDSQLFVDFNQDNGDQQTDKEQVMKLYSKRRQDIASFEESYNTGRALVSKQQINNEDNDDYGEEEIEAESSESYGEEILEIEEQNKQLNKPLRQQTHKKKRGRKEEEEDVQQIEYQEEENIDQDEIDADKNQADLDRFNKLEIYTSVIQLINRHKINREEFDHVFDIEQFKQNMHSIHIKSQRQQPQLARKSGKTNVQYIDFQLKTEQQIEVIKDLEIWLATNRLFIVDSSKKQKKLKYKNLAISDLKIGFKDLIQSYLQTAAKLPAVYTNIFYKVNFLLEITQHKDIIKNYKVLLNQIQDLASMKNKSNKKMPLVDEEIKQLQLKKGKSMPLFKASLEEVSKEFIKSNSFLINLDQFDEKDLKRTMKCIEDDKALMQELTKKLKSYFDSNQKSHLNYKTQFGMTLSAEMPNQPRDDNAADSNSKIVIKKGITFIEQIASSQGAKENASPDLIATVKEDNALAKEYDMPQKLFSLVIEQEEKTGHEQLFSIRLLKEEYFNENGKFYLAVRMRDESMQEDLPSHRASSSEAHTSKMQLFFTRNSDQRSIWSFQKYKPQNEVHQWKEKGVWKKQSQYTQGEKAFVRSKNKFYLRHKKWNWARKDEKYQGFDNLIKDFERKYYYLQIDKYDNLKMEQADLIKQESGIETLMKKVTIWTFEAFNDKRTIDYETQIHRIVYEQNEYSKQMAINDILYQLKQTNFDLSRVKIKRYNHFKGKPLYGHANAFNGRFEFWMYDPVTAQSQNSPIIHQSHNMMKKMSLQFPTYAQNFINNDEEYRENFGQFTRQGRISGNIYYYSQTHNVLGIHKLGTIDEFHPGLESKKITWEFLKDYIQRKNGELFTLDELREFFSNGDITKKLKNSKFNMNYLNEKSIWVPFRTDDDDPLKNKHNFMQVRDAIKVKKTPIFKKTLEEVFYQEVPKYPVEKHDLKGDKKLTEEDIILGENAFKCVIYQQNDEMQFFEFPGNIHSIIEVADEQILVSFKIDNKYSFLVNWNTKQNEEFGIYEIDPKEKRDTMKFKNQQLKLCPCEFLQIRETSDYNVDRDMALDIIQSNLYTCGPENQVFKLLCHRDNEDAGTFINQGCVQFKAQLLSLRLSSDFKMLYVATKDQNLHLVDTNSMNVVHYFSTGFTPLRDFGFSFNDEMMVSTHADGHWKLWKQSQEHQYQRIYRSEKTGSEFFQVEFNEKDFYLTQVLDQQFGNKTITLLEYPFDYDHRNKSLDFSDKKRWSSFNTIESIILTKNNKNAYFIYQQSIESDDQTQQEKFQFKVLNAKLSQNILQLSEKDGKILYPSNLNKYELDLTQLFEIPLPPKIDKLQINPKAKFIVLAKQLKNEELPCLLALNGEFNIENVIQFNEFFNQFRILDHQHIAIWEAPKAKTEIEPLLFNIYIYKLPFSEQNEIKNTDGNDNLRKQSTIQTSMNGTIMKPQQVTSLYDQKWFENSKFHYKWHSRFSYVEDMWFIVSSPKESKKDVRILTQLKFNGDQNNLETIQLVDIKYIPDIKSVFVNSDSKKLAILTKPPVFENNTIDQLFGQLLIWDISPQNQQNGYLMVDHLDLRETEIQNIGFFQTQSKLLKNVPNDYLWYLTNDNEFDHKKDKEEEFKIYSLTDHRVIYSKKVVVRYNKFFENVIIDKDNSNVYFVDSRGIYLTDIMYQIHDNKLSMQNFVQFCTYQTDQGYSMFQEQINEFTVFPQMQNMLHLFCIEDLGEELSLALQDGQLTTLYHSDIDQMSPIQIAESLQCDQAYQAIIKSFDFTDDLFITKEDLKILTVDPNQNANIALDKIFRPSIFIDKEGNVERGRMFRSFFQMIVDNITGSDELAQKIYFESKSKYLWFQEQKIDTGVREYYKKGGVLPTTIDQKQQSSLKIEYLTLQFKAPFLRGSDYSNDVLELMAEAANRELFRSQIKQIVDYKWDQLYPLILRYNGAIAVYFIFLIYVQMEFFDFAEMQVLYFIHLVLTIIVTLPEFYQNLLTISKYFQSGSYSFEDFQNNFELSGYFLQIVYSVLYMSGFLQDEDNGYTRRRDVFQMNLLSCLFLFLRAFFLLRVVDSFRPYIRMIKEVTVNLGPFTTIVVVTCFLLAVLFFMMNELHVEIGNEDDPYLSFEIFFLQHVTLITAGAYNEEIVNMDNTGNFFLFTIAFYLMFILLLNLLISIVSERFGIVLEQTIQMDCVERVSLMLEMENFIRLYNRIFKKTEAAQEEVFINYCRYMQFAGEDEPDTDIEVEGRIRYIQDKIRLMNEDVDLSYDNMDQKKEELQEVIKKLSFQCDTNSKIREQQIEANTKIEMILSKVQNMSQRLKEFESKKR